MMLPKFPNKKMVPKVSRSVHARFSVIVGLLLVNSRSFASDSRSLSVHARFTLAILGPWQFIYHAFVAVLALDSQ